MRQTYSRARKKVKVVSPKRRVRNAFNPPISALGGRLVGCWATTRPPGARSAPRPRSSRVARVRSASYGGSRKTMSNRTPSRSRSACARATSRRSTRACAATPSARTLASSAATARGARPADLGQPRLAGAEELARPAQRQIHLGDPEAVVRRDHPLDPAPAVLGEAPRREQDAVRLPRAAPHTPAPLVGLRG